MLLGKDHTNRDYSLAVGAHTVVGLAKTMNFGLLQSNPVSFTVQRGIIIDTSGDMDKAIDLIKKQRYAEAIVLLQIMISNSPGNAIAYYNLACAYSLSNQTEKALEALEMSFRCGYNDFSNVWVDSDLVNIRNLPRFDELIRIYRYR